MSLIGIVGDIHLGINEHKYLFNEYHVKCLKYIFSEFKKRGIDTIIYLGDIFDKRYSISTKTLKECDNLFKNNGFKQYFLVGNHDVTYKNSNELNSVEILLGDLNKVVVNTPEEIEFGGKKFLLVPWLNKTNIVASTRIVRESKANYLLGHLDLSGFEMIRGFVSNKGNFPTLMLKKFQHVISGHFHCYSQKGNITFLGNICEMNWNDYNVNKHFGYIDTETDEFNLIDIPFKMYHVIRIKSSKDLVNPKEFKDKIVKCYLYTRRSIKIEKYITQLVDNCLQVNVVDEQVINATVDFNIDEHNMSVVDLWSAYLNEMDIRKKDATICNKIFSDVYMKVTSGDVT